MANITVTNPGTVNVADEAFDSLPAQVPPVGGPASASLNNINPADQANLGTGLPKNVFPT